MSAAASNSSSTPDLQELFELLSRQLDGDLSREEELRLAVFESAHPDAALEFRRHVGVLSCRLKQIPVQPVEGMLFEMPLATPKAVIVPDPLNASGRSGSQRFVVGAVTSLLCAGLLFALTRSTETQETTLLAEAEVLHGTMEARAGIGGAGRGMPMSADGPAATNSLQMKVAAEMPPNVLMGAAAPGESESAVKVLPEGSLEPDVQPLIQSDDWNVVVVRIDSKDRDQAMDQIQAIARKAGLQLKEAADPVESRWLGVVLASDVTGREEVVNAMEGVGASRGYLTEVPPVDSPEAMFIEAARESLKHPTRSELHHGKVFVALPSSSPSDSESQIVAAAGNADPGSDSNTSETPKLLSGAAEVPAARSAKVAAKAVRDVTLVVFEFSDAEKSGPNSPGQQI